MLELRLTQHPAKRGRHKVEIALEGDGARRTAESTFAFSLSSQDEEALRWYLEDFLQYPQEPAPAIAARIEARLAEIGRELFEKVFRSSDDARDLWARMSDRLSETRVEIVTGVAEASSIPWELLRDPKTDIPLALSAQAFVRAQPGATGKPRLPKGKAGKVRILLVICRPRGGVDVPFRSVASRLVKGLDQATRETYDLVVLRPPTFEQLARVLREAKAAGRPYHVVHFDGHGTFGEIVNEVGDGGLGSLLRGLSAVVMANSRGGGHGYLLFENPQLAENAQLVDGPAMGKLLAENDVSVLVLNACKSAHAEPGEKPGAEADPHSQVRAFGSLAQEVMDAGTAGVVAMRYNVYVVTAAQLAAELYASLAQGATLGEAVTRARKNLSESPLREIAFEPRALQDWSVPVVYEAAPLQIFPRTKGRPGELKIRVKAGASAAGAAEGSLDEELPKPPDAGFFGRDETLLALDRAFDRDSIVLLHAYAGSGKTSTAAEFARWYALTGGAEGPVLFTSFERYLPLSRVLDRIGQVFGPALERSGVHWLALDDASRREIALQVLAQVPVLWIWDNVEPVAGFPIGAPSAWSPEEQEELASFLRAAKATKAKFLLTARRNERPWLGDLPTRVKVPPMPMTEALQLARALAEKHGRRLSAIEDWRPLLDFAQGNPMTLTVLVGQALREDWTSRETMAEHIALLRTGEADFPDEAREGRARSLAASLAYGFEHAFNEEERGRLALLHLFQGFVEVAALRLMGDPEDLWCLPAVNGLAREEGIALLDRAAEVGLLTAHGGGYYSIHPALPWFFQGLYRQCYPEDSNARRAFVEAMGELGNYYQRQYQGGNRDVLDLLRAEEANLLHAHSLARARSWWNPVIKTMQGLRTLYDHTGRRAEWKRLVEEIVPDFVDAETGRPRPGREGHWSFATEYRVRLAQEERRWADAERLQTDCVSWDRRRAAPARGKPAGELDSKERNARRTLAVSLHELAEIRRELGSNDCVLAYEESLALAERIGDHSLAAVCALNLGTAFKSLPPLRDLDAAERWYRKSLELRSKTDGVGRGKCHNQLGSVAWERFKEARSSGRPEAEFLQHLNEAARLYHEALGLLPPDAVDDLAAAYNQLGGIYGVAGDLDRALPHYQESIRLNEQSGNLYGAALTRYNVALALLAAGRRADALDYAEAALRGFEPYRKGAEQEIELTRRLIADIRGSR